MDVDRLMKHPGEKDSFLQLAEYCRLQNKKGTNPHFLIVNNPDFEYVACLHVPEYKGQEVTRFLQTVGKSGREILSVVAYGLVLSAMTAGAITYCVQQRDFGSLLTAAGAVGFFVSDNILIWRLLSGCESRLQGAVLLLFYYGGVFLIAAGQVVG